MSRTTSKADLTDEDIEFIMSNTDLDRGQILRWHQDFKEKCPQNRLNKSQFILFYKHLIPGESTSLDHDRFCEAVFRAFDTDSNGYVDFAEFLLAFWIRASGSLKDKLAWLFEVYDTDRSNYITESELTSMLKLVLSIKNIKEDPREKTREIFLRIDRSKDGKISRQEFIAGCTQDEKLRNLLAPF